jgi:hypothetical protein
MSVAPARSHTPTHAEPHLRLVEGLADRTSNANRCEWDAARESALTDDAAHVLIAGADTHARTRMLEELRDLLPTGTRFAQATETWEVIAEAPTTNMVVLAGDLGDVSGDTVMRLLGRRYPTLPVLAVTEKTPTHTAADVGVAHA